MPPKGILRPAAAGPARAKAKAVAKAGAKASARVRGVLKRPAKKAGEDVQGDKNISEVFAAGGEVAVGDLPLQEWKTGDRVVFTEAIYWEEKVRLAGVVKSLKVESGQVHMSLKLEGTREESLVKWAGAHPGKLLEIHLCPLDCGRLSKDGLVHAIKARRWKETEKDAWMDNLLDVRATQEDEVDELQKVRDKADERDKERIREQRAPGASGHVGSLVSSESEEESKKKKKAKKKKKKQEGREKSRIVGTKELATLFGTTALDPSPGVRRRVRKKAKKAARRKSKRGESSSTSSQESSSGTGGSPDEAGHLFGEEVRVKAVSKRFPGALTLNTLEMIQTAVVSQTGQPWELNRDSLPPIFSQYWRMALSSRMSGAMNREAQTLCYVQDLLLQGKVALCCDTVTQRLKSLEQVAQGSHFSIAQRQELVPLDMSLMTSPREALEASRLHHEEAKARNAAARPWPRTQEWERRGDDHKGKGKGRDQKGKGKAKGEKGGQQREERERDKK